MSVALDAGDVEHFKDFVSRRLGLDVDNTRLGVLADLLRRRLETTGGSCAAFLDQLATPQGEADLHAIIAELTVPETYFFRNIDQFRAFTDVALPERLRARSATKHVRILSAGCASGEEPYSLAILVRQAALDPSWNVSIAAVDLNRTVLEKAARGQYSRWALRETPADVGQRWFSPQGADFVLDETIRAAVTFEEHNLTDPSREPWPPGTFDVIFWRNVMMYFTPKSAATVVARITRALAPGGYLFLGHAETLRGMSNDFHLRHTHGTFYYQRKPSTEPRSHVAGVIAAGARSEPLAAAFDGADSWVETIHKASQRIRALAAPPVAGSLATTGPSVPSVPSAPSAPTVPAWSLTLALELLEKERYAEALALVRALPPESAAEPNVLLLRAVLLTHSGQLAAAEEACAELLAVDQLDAGAHYLLALCREGAGDRSAAADHDQIAAYLDPAFAMPRLHLGLLSRRANDREGARRDLGQALVLLQREDASRLALFGGGFGRGALVALCRTELIACGGAP